VVYGNVSNGQVKADYVDRTYNMHWVKKNAYGILVRKPGRKRPLGRPRRRWKNNIKLDLKERGMGSYVLESSGAG
jgi:hypothetical protein